MFMKSTFSLLPHPDFPLFPFSPTPFLSIFFSPFTLPISLLFCLPLSFSPSLSLVVLWIDPGDLMYVQDEYSTSKLYPLSLVYHFGAGPVIQFLRLALNSFICCEVFCFSVLLPQGPLVPSRGWGY